MRALDPGHLYQLDVLDNAAVPTLRFVKRIGEKYPGNDPPAYGGTITQEVIRALIDRTEYVNGQRQHVCNGLVLHHLREALRALEMRAAEERKDIGAMFRISCTAKPELLSTCTHCGHVECHRDNHV